MKVYHGTTLTGLMRLLAANGNSDNWYGLSVTDTYERARDYACAQATGIVKSDCVSMAEGNVVVELEAETVTWHRRSANHNTLDKCEAVINTWRVRHIYVRPYDYCATVIGKRGHYRKADEYLTELQSQYDVTILKD